MAATLPTEVRKEKERQAWLRRQQLWSLQAIADELEVDVSTVSRMLDRVETRLAREFSERAARLRARQTAQLEHVASEAMQEWLRSKQPTESERTVHRLGQPRAATPDDPNSFEPAEEITEIIRDVKGQCGNPALLGQVRGALSDIRSIWGLDAPSQVRAEHTGKDGRPIEMAVGISFEEALKALRSPDADDEGADPGV